MATIAGGSYPLEFNFIDNPIMVGVTNFAFPTDATFRQVVVQVDVTPTFSGSSPTTYKFYADASADDTVWLDISTALRGAMGAWVPETKDIIPAGDSTFTYPYANFNITIFEKYLLEGTVYEEQTTERTGAYAYYGGMTEYERLVSGKHPADIYLSDGSKRYISRKPIASGKGEIIETGFYRTYSYSMNGKMYTHSYPTTADNEGNQGYDGAGYFWQLPVSGERRQFAFVNSLGVIETIMAQSRESLSYDIESNTKSLVNTPQYKPNPNITTHKTGGRNKWQMSSGKVNREWADWWVTEFLMAKKYWMLHNGMWLPVVVTPADDSMEIYNRSDNNLPHVDFDVQLAVKGSITNLIKN